MEATTRADERPAGGFGPHAELRLFEVRTPGMASALVLESNAEDAKRRAIAADASFAHYADALEVYELTGADLAHAGVIWWSP